MISEYSFLLIIHAENGRSPDSKAITGVIVLSEDEISRASSEYLLWNIYLQRYENILAAPRASPSSVIFAELNLTTDAISRDDKSRVIALNNNVMLFRLIRR